MRGFLDFETYQDAAYQWQPLCCGFVWGPPGERAQCFVHDETQQAPQKLARDALKIAHRLADAGVVKEWWAHNGGKFDHLYLLQAAVEMGWEASAHVAGGSRLIFLSVRPPDAKVAVNLYDSFAVVPERLAKAAESFQLASRKVFTDADYKGDMRELSLERLKPACLADCHVGLELLEKVEALAQGWGGDLRSTFSQVALRIVKARLAEQGLELPSHEGNQDANRYSRGGYYGARVEVLHHAPPEEVFTFDLNSSYPASAKLPLPWELVGTAQSPRHVRAVLEGDGCEGMVEATVEVPPMAFPPLPWRSKERGIYFPTGRWQGVFPAVELRYARTLGVKVQAHGAVRYTRESPLASFVDDVYALKARSEGAVRSFTKFLLNGFTGKLGQAPEQETLRVVSTEDEGEALLLGAPVGTAGKIGDDARFLVFRRNRWPKHTHFAAISYIVANSRIALHRGMLECLSVAYVDADSLHVRFGQTPSNVGFELGQWKPEKAVARAWYYAPKVYRLNLVDGGLFLAAKGFPIRHRDGTWNLDAFEKMVASESVEVERMQLAKSQLRNGGDVSRLAGPRVERRRWHGYSMKRKPKDDGTTVPWTVEELLAGRHYEARSPLAATAGNSKKTAA